MKLKRLILSLALLSGVCFADEAMQIQPIGPFGGLNTNISQEAIDSNQSPDLLNVDISPGGKSVKKRQGYGLDATLTISTSAVHNLYKFFDSSGNEIRLAFNDVNVNASVNGAAWSVILTTGVSAGATWDCTDYLGYAYCVSSNFDAPIKTNGTIAGSSGVGGTNAVPAGSIVSNSGDRLLVGATAANPSRLYYSASAVFTDFSLGTQSSSSSFEDIVAPGSKLTHIAYRFGRWLWWKEQSFGFIVGTGQFDLQIVVVSNTIGTLDNTDVFDGNYVYFRGQDGMIYTYDGSNLSRSISTDIGPTLKSANRRKTSLWNQTTASDFNSGTGVSIDTTSTPGSVQLINYQTSFASGLSIWTQNTSTLWKLSSDGLFATPNGSIAEIKLSNPATILSSNFILHVQFSLYNADNSSYLTDFGVGWVNESGNGYGVENIAGGSNIFKQGTYAAGSGVSLLGSSTANTIATADTSNHTIDLIFSATGYAQAYFDGSLRGNFTNSATTGMDRLYLFCNATSGTPNYCDTSVLAISVSTGTYYSAVHSAPLFTSWNSFFANASTNGGTITYYSRGSTGSFLPASPSPAWVAQTNGSIVSASTGAYMQERIDFSVSAATQTPILNDFTFNWLEGTNTDKMYGTYFNNGIWFSVALGTATTNNRIFRYDLLSNLWTLYDIPASGFLTYTNNLYFGSPTVGSIYQFGQGVQTDNGASINAYWKSKAFFGTDPFADKDLRLASWYIAKDQTATLSLIYTLNESTSVSRSLSLNSSNKNIIQNNWNFPLGSVATNFNIQFGDTSTNPPWEVFGGAIYYVPRPWKVSLQ